MQQIYHTVGTALRYRLLAHNRALDWRSVVTLLAACLAAQNLSEWNGLHNAQFFLLRNCTDSIGTFTKKF